MPSIVMDPKRRPQSNPFLIPNVILTMGITCQSSKPLRNLRQLSCLYYKMLNKKFLDKVDNTISITQGKIVDFSVVYKSDEKFGSDEVYDDSDPEDEDEVPVVKKLKKREITLTNWDPSMASIFRKLKFNEFESDNKIIQDTERNWPVENILRLIDSLVPYITTLLRPRIEACPVIAQELSNEMIFQANKFTKVTKLELALCDNDWDTQSLDQLSQDISRLTIKPQISLRVKYWAELFAKYIIGPEGRNLQSNIHQLYFRNIRSSTVRELEEFANLVSENKDALLKLSTKIDYMLTIELGRGNLDPGDSIVVLNSLNKLSPFLSDLHIEDFKLDLDIIDPISWPILTGLTLLTTKIPIEIFANIPNIKTIYMSPEQQLCLFKNREKSDEDNLLQVFGSCKALKMLKFAKFEEDNKTEQKIKDGNDLYKFLIKLLPNTKIIAKHTYK